MRAPVCDFCFAPDPQWRYACEPFTAWRAPGRAWFSTSLCWRACDACRLLIERDDWARLTDVTAAAIAAFPGIEWDELPPVLKPFLTEVYRNVRTHRLGEAVRGVGR